MKATLLLRTLGALLLAAAAPVSAAKRASYVTSGDCDGYPRVPVQTAPGLCVGLVAEKLGFARGVAVLGDDIYVTDMGGWQPRRGRLLMLPALGRQPMRVLLRKLDQPNALADAGNGQLYLGVRGKIQRLDPKAAQITPADVVTGLPGDGRHPLTAFTVDGQGALYIGVGALTDHCETPAGKPPNPAAPCPETAASPPRASILRAVPGKRAVDARTLKPYARGLRNAVALAALPSGRLLAASNARDSINLANPLLPDEELPHEPMMLVQQGADYGWPYCFDIGAPSPEYPDRDCSGYARPNLLLPAHTAPLGLLAYAGKSIPQLENSVLAGYHGYRRYGHRIARMALGADGRPAGQPQDLVWDWDYVQGQKPRGAPVSLAQLKDGSVLITEDHNGSLLRLALEQK